MFAHLSALFVRRDAVFLAGLIFACALMLQTPGARPEGGRAVPEKPAAHQSRKPLKVFIRAGQSNMQGHASIATLHNQAPPDPPRAAAEPPQPAEMAGYLLVPHSRVPREYNGGFSMYVAAWPLLKNYPGQEFQSGLFGTWMFAQYDGKGPENAYSDIEGGLGWWRDTRFATETPKFIMGGVALNFVEWANGPGAGKGRDWNNPMGHYAVAQLSPWVLWPPDGLNLKQGTAGELFGYGYLPLPLLPAKKTTAGKNIPTGDHCWTLFLNTGNFKGPVAFFLPYFWSKPTLERPELAGMSSTPAPPSLTRRCRWRHNTYPRTSAGMRRGTSMRGLHRFNSQRRLMATPR
jgi:hypothetical protein